MTASQTPLQAFIAGRLGESGGASALAFHGRSTRYRSLQASVSGVAHGLASLGARADAPIALLLPDCPQVLVYALAALSIGAPLVPLDPSAAMSTLIASARACEPKFLVTTDQPAIFARAFELSQAIGIESVVVVSFAAMLPPLKAAHTRLFTQSITHKAPLAGSFRVVGERELSALQDWPVPHVDPVEVGSADRAAILTTRVLGDSHRVATITHGNLMASVSALTSAYARFVPTLPLPGGRVVAALALWDPLGLTLALTLGIGGGREWIIVPNLLAKELVAAIRANEPEIIIAPACVLNEALASPELGPRAVDKLRSVIVVGGVLSDHAREVLGALSQATILDTYATTSPPAFVTLAAREVGGQGIGLALDATRVTIRDRTERGQEVPAGERGEVCVSGPQFARDIAPLGDITTADDLRTGDFGLLDARGDLVIIDRIDDLIFTDGYLIYPKRIETALLTYPGVVEAAVIAIPHGGRGSAPKAFVSLKRGVAVTERDLRLFLATQLSRIEMPADIDFCKTLPKDAFGLVCKATLRAQHATDRGLKV